jgi:hypothetical protein
MRRQEMLDRAAYQKATRGKESSGIIPKGAVKLDENGKVVFDNRFEDEPDPMKNLPDVMKAAWVRHPTDSAEDVAARAAVADDYIAKQTHVNETQGRPPTQFDQIMGALSPEQRQSYLNNLATDKPKSDSAKLQEEKRILEEDGPEAAAAFRASWGRNVQQPTAAQERILDETMVSVDQGPLIKDTIAKARALSKEIPQVGGILGKASAAWDLLTNEARTAKLNEFQQLIQQLALPAFADFLKPMSDSDRAAITEMSGDAMSAGAARDALLERAGKTLDQRLHTDYRRHARVLQSLGRDVPEYLRDPGEPLPTKETPAVTASPAVPPPVVGAPATSAIPAPATQPQKVRRWNPTTKKWEDK